MPQPDCLPAANFPPLLRMLVALPRSGRFQVCLAIAKEQAMTFTRAALAAIAILSLAPVTIPAQGLPPAGRGGRGIPGATPEQIAAVAQMSADLAAPTQRLTDARAEMVASALAQPRNDAAIKARVEAVRSAELALANARAGAFARLQASSNKLAAGQIPAAAMFGGASFGAGGRGGAGSAPRSSMPHVSAKQAIALTEMTSGLTAQSQALSAARAEVIQAAFAVPRNDAAIEAKIEAVAKAELALANARADALAKFQSTPDKLDAEQHAWLV